MNTALTEHLAATGANLGAYSGVSTAAHFGDTDAELATLLRAGAVYDLGWRGTIEVTGEDRVRWLNGMVTNNVRDLEPNHGNYNFLLSPQGRIQGDMFVFNRGDHMLIESDREQVPALLKLLDHYIIMDDVELAGPSDELAAIGVQGPDAPRLLQALGIGAPKTPLVVHEMKHSGEPLTVVRMPSERFHVFVLWVAPDQTASLWNELVAAGAKPVGFEALEKFRVLAGVPRFGQDIRDKHLPQETSQAQALNFNKGCYVGQEIVERIKSRGQVHRSLTGFELQGPAIAGAKLLSGDKEVGELTSVARIRLNGYERVFGLGIIRREAVSATLAAGDVTATVIDLPPKGL